MSLERYRALEEEHGKLESNLRTQQDTTVKSRFTLFYLVVLIAHIVLVAFSVLYMATYDGSEVKIGVCYRNSTVFLNLYSELAETAATNVNISSASYDCVSLQNDATWYLMTCSFSVVLIACSFAMHLKLPLDTCWMPYWDAFVVVMVYILNMIGPALAVFMDIGSWYLIPSLHGARVRWATSFLQDLLSHAATRVSPSIRVCRFASASPLLWGCGKP